MSETVLIQGGRIIDPSQQMDGAGDLLIEDGKIHSIDLPGRIPKDRASRVLQANGCWVMPGLIDVHVHLREPGLEYKETIETGTLAAVKGGFTSVACMANTQPVNDSPYITAFIREKAKAVGACRVFPIGAVTKGLLGQELAEIGKMVEEGAVAISDDGMPVMNSYLMRKAMEYAKTFGIPVISHAEDANLVANGVMNEGSLSNELGLKGNPAAAEEIMVAREIAICRLTKNPVHIAHISTEIGLEHVRRAKEAGLPVTAEATPHHLVLTEEAMKTYDTNFKMAPPLRSERDVEALRKALSEGLVDLIATDHAPHAEFEKKMEFDQAMNGILGLQTAVPTTLGLVHQGIVSPMRWVESLSTRPARLIGKPLGTLRRGSIADITVLDPDQTWTFQASDLVSKSQNTPFIHWEFRGKVMHVLVGGDIR